MHDTEPLENEIARLIASVELLTNQVQSLSAYNLKLESDLNEYRISEEYLRCRLGRYLREGK